MRYQHHLKKMLLGLGIAFASQVQGLSANASSVEYLQITQCLAQKLSGAYPVLAHNRDFHIIAVQEADWRELQTTADANDCGRFVNVTKRIVGQRQDMKIAAEAVLNTDAPSMVQSRVGADWKIAHDEIVSEAINRVVPDNIWQNLTHLTNFYNRSATKPTGVEAANWLQGQVMTMATQYNRQDVESYFVQTGRYKQPSLVTVIGKKLPGKAVVIGAHMDTLDGRMPGAGDDGSGSATILEMMRVLLEKPQALKHPVYVIWYAAEERGLVGSQYVVEDFQAKNIPVEAAIQFDMTGFRNDENDRSIWVFDDYTHKPLSRFVADLIGHYVKVPVKHSRCGYGCSDHASWTDAGIPSAFPCETDFEHHNPYIHSEADSMELLSLDHLTNFTKLAVAFALEMALS